MCVITVMGMVTLPGIALQILPRVVPREGGKEIHKERATTRNEERGRHSTTPGAMVARGTPRAKVGQVMVGGERAEIAEVELLRIRISPWTNATLIRSRSPASWRWRLPLP